MNAGIACAIGSTAKSTIAGREVQPESGSAANGVPAKMAGSKAGMWPPRKLWPRKAYHGQYWAALSRLSGRPSRSRFQVSDDAPAPVATTTAASACSTPASAPKTPRRGTASAFAGARYQADMPSGDRVHQHGVVAGGALRSGVAVLAGLQ